MRAVLRLRTEIEQARHRRWLGLLVVALLALLIVFVIIHDAEHALDGMMTICVALTFVAGVLAAQPRQHLLVSRRVSSRHDRSPPGRERSRPHSDALVRAPLRL